MAQEQVNEGGELPVIVHYLPGARLAASTAARRPSLVLLSRNTVLPCPTLSEKSWGDSVHAVDCPPDLGLRVDGGAHHAGERYHAVRPPRLCWNHGRRPWMEPSWGWRAKNRQTLFLVPGLLRRRWY